MSTTPTPSTALTQYRLHHSSLYDPAYCVEMLNYFISATTTATQRYEESIEEEQGVKGVTRRAKSTNRIVVGQIPKFENFASSIGVTTATLRTWAAKHPDFGYTYERCKEVLKSFLIQASASGAIPPATAIFLMTNLTDMRSESNVVVQTEKAVEKPVLADYTPAQLQAAREALEKCEMLGIKLMVQEGPGAAQASSEGEAA